MPHEAMLAHYPGDKTVAKAICARLEARGISTWFGPRDNKSNVRMEDASMRALEDASIVVLVLSTNSSTSPQLHNEVDAAHDLGIPIVSLIGDLVRLPGKLHSYITHPVHIQQAGKVFASDLNNVVDAAQLAIEEGMSSATSADEDDPYANTFADDDDAVALGGIGGGSGLLELTSDDIPDDDVENEPPSYQSQGHPDLSNYDPNDSSVRSHYADEPSAHRHDDDDPYDDLFGDEPDVYEPKLNPDLPARELDSMPPKASPGSGSSSGRYAPVQQGAPATPTAPDSMSSRQAASSTGADSETALAPPPAPPRSERKRGLFAAIGRLFRRR